MNALALLILSPIMETHAKCKLVPSSVMSAGSKSLYLWIEKRASRNSLTFSSAGNRSHYSNSTFSRGTMTIGNVSGCNLLKCLVDSSVSQQRVMNLQQETIDKMPNNFAGKI